jgi:hypothetical protein
MKTPTTFFVYDEEEKTYFAYVHVNGTEMGFGMSTLNMEEAKTNLITHLANRLTEISDALVKPQERQKNANLQNG